jgi:hypothetical protein
VYSNYFPSNTIRVIVSKNETGVECGMEVHTGFWWGNMRAGDHLEDIGVDGSIILKWIFKKYDEGSVD